MDLKEKMRVKVNSAFGVGFGWITHIADFFYCPIQVQLDEPSYDGHSLMRFEHAEITPVEFTVKEPKNALLQRIEEKVKPIVELGEKSEKVEVEPEAVEVEPKKEKPPVNMLVRMVKKINGYSFEKGDVFAASEVGTKYNSCYYLYNPETFEMRGCMVKEAFELLHDNLSPSDISRKAAIYGIVKTAVEKKPEKPAKKHKTVTKIVKPDKPENVEQMDIFSFL